MRGIDTWSKEREMAENLGFAKVLAKDFKRDNGEMRYELMMWKPKAIKPHVNYYFKSPEKRQEYIDQQLLNLKSWKEEKEKRKLDRCGTQEQIDSVKVGDIFHFSWGYDQTNCDFYQVTEKKAKTVVIREIAQKSVEKSAGFMSENVLPVKDRFLEKSEPMTKRIQFSMGKPFLTMASYGWCDLWDGQPCYCSWGH